MMELPLVCLFFWSAPLLEQGILTCASADDSKRSLRQTDQDAAESWTSKMLKKPENASSSFDRLRMRLRQAHRSTGSG
jgi:hypothetical protein